MQLISWYLVSMVTEKSVELDRSWFSVLHLTAVSVSGVWTQVNVPHV